MPPAKPAVPAVPDVVEWMTGEASLKPGEISTRLEFVAPPAEAAPADSSATGKK